MIIVLATIWSVAHFISLSNESKKLKLAKIEERERKLARDLDELVTSQEHLQEDKEGLERLVAEKTEGFPWLADAYADYIKLVDMQRARYLEAKKRPALKAAEQVREIARERRKSEKAYRVLKYRINYYENLFPWLIEFVGEDVDELLRIALAPTRTTATEDKSEDPARHWLAPGEYKSLIDMDKYQLALDRYRQKKKTKWEIGRDYERYVGYIYEQRGYDVNYQGILKGFDDLGRDVIATKKQETHIVQCKYWSKDKIIHEKHIFQLFGTTIEYYLSNDIMENVIEKNVQIDLFLDKIKKRKITPVFIASTILSKRAHKFANMLGIVVREKISLEDYPLVKCNVSRRNKEKIYHLPFDQQYDRVIIEPEKGEFYAWSVKEAEEAGFRRAWRWRPTDDE